jgi:hypothetical protein
MTMAVWGEGVESLPDEIAANQRDAVLVEEGPVRLALFESYYLRINADLLTVVICTHAGEGEWRVRIISGGGAVGLMPSTLGAESAANRKALELIHSIGQKRGWDIVLP